MTGSKTHIPPVVVSILAARRDYCERTRIKAMRRAGIRVAEIAEALGYHCLTIYRELNRPGCRPVYDAEAAQAA